MTENERVKYLREVALPNRDGHRYSQDEFVSGIGIKKAALSLIENGRNNLTDSVRLLICNKYLVRDEWLRDGKGEIFKRGSESELDALCSRYGLNDRSRIFIKEFAELGDSERQAILDYVEKVASALREEPAAAADSTKSDTTSADSDQQLHEDLQRDIDLRKKPEEKSSGSGSMPA